MALEHGLRDVGGSRGFEQGTEGRVEHCLAALLIHCTSLRSFSPSSSRLLTEKVS